MTLLLDTIKCTNELLAQDILQNLLNQGVKEFCLCPGARNSPFVTVLHQNPQVKSFYFYEERSAAFFALGRSKALNAPVAVVVTSGTAAAELLPAAMESYYTGIPLVLITADRPKRYRGSNAPQAAEQVGLFGQYAVFEADIAAQDFFSSLEWSQKGPAHINVCFEEPHKGNIEDSFPLKEREETFIGKTFNETAGAAELESFLQKVKNPLVIVGGLKGKDQNQVLHFLKTLGAPVFLEGISGLREHPELQPLRIARSEHILKFSADYNYPIDGVIRIGGIPTFRLWRDLELLEGKIPVFSLNDVPFSGLSWGTIHCHPIREYLSNYKNEVNVDFPKQWKEADLDYQAGLKELFRLLPNSEQAICYKISQSIFPSSVVYLGNSMPIREWDEYAEAANKNLSVYASRGLNGIDGQISTFLGLCRQDVSNYGLFGDLTALYDLAAPWILREMPGFHINILIMNNGGGRIFSKMFPIQEIQNLHNLHFKPLAEMWGLGYHCLTNVDSLPAQGQNIIELRPDWEQTQRFWDLVK